MSEWKIDIETITRYFFQGIHLNLKELEKKFLSLHRVSVEIYVGMQLLTSIHRLKKRKNYYTWFISDWHEFSVVYWFEFTDWWVEFTIGWNNFLISILLSTIYLCMLKVLNSKKGISCLFTIYRIFTCSLLNVWQF